MTSSASTRTRLLAMISCGSSPATRTMYADGTMNPLKVLSPGQNLPIFTPLRVAYSPSSRGSVSPSVSYFTVPLLQGLP